MKTFSVQYAGSEKLAAFVQRHKLTSFGNRLLVQAFVDSLDEALIRELHADLTTQLPEAAILGTTSCGSIMNGRVYEGAIILHFMAFDAGQLRTRLLPKNGEDDQQLGRELARQLVGPETQMLILFTEAMGVSKRAVLEGVHAECPRLPIAGGAAGSPNLGFDSWIFDRHAVSATGAMAAAIDVPQLRIHTGYSLNWQPIGRVMTVTDGEGNLLRSLDGQPAAEVYRRYLGSEILENIALYGMMFPLVMQRDGVQVARTAATVLEDGSIYFGGDIQKGDRVQFAYGHLPSILNKNEELVEQLQPEGYDALLLYSCVARRAFMREAAQLETLPLQKIAPAAGFFTYGEFYRGPESVQLLNSTLTYVALSDRAIPEGRRQRAELAAVNKEAADDQRRLMGALTQLVKTYTEEIEAANIQLNNYVEELRTLLEQLSEQNAQIEQQKLEIEEKNESLTDSIHYARRIQTALLPSEDIQRSCWPNLSIWYAPRDIVSGDFYWMAEAQGRRLLAVVDCTGHGVPGAFMALIGYQALNRIVHEEGITQPCRILDRLDAHVRQILNQDAGSGSQDGMDVVLVSYDPASATLEFAGANRPLYIQRPGQPLDETKGSRVPVGGTLIENKNYQTETLNVETGLRIYLTSDGIVDQLGGGNGRKFTPKRLRDTLEATAHQSLDAQVAALQAAFTDWKGAGHQLDDICLLAVGF